MELWIFEKALELYGKALEIEIQSLCHFHADVARTEMNIRHVLSAQGDHENELLHLNKALAMQELEVALGPSHPSVAMTNGNMGYVYEQLGNLAQAQSCFEEVYRIFLQSLGPDHPNTRHAARDLRRFSDWDQGKSQHSGGIRTEPGPEHHNTEKATRALQRLQSSSRWAHELDGWGLSVFSVTWLFWLHEMHVIKRK
jgi:tetratricopeptide (TPR) repeat protein